MKVGFIGLGNMGSAIARNLIKAGHDLTVYNRTRSRAEALTSLGASIAETPAEAASDAQVLITMLANDAAVEDVIFGAGNSVEALPVGAVHVSMSCGRGGRCPDADGEPYPRSVCGSSRTRAGRIRLGGDRSRLVRERRTSERDHRMIHRNPIVSRRQLLTVPGTLGLLAAKERFFTRSGKDAPAGVELLTEISTGGCVHGVE